MKTLVAAVMAVQAGLAGGGVAAAAERKTPWSVGMADSEIARHPDPMTLDSEQPKWEYTHGLVLKAIQAVGERTKDPRYEAYVRAYYDGMIAADGSIRTYDASEFNIDRINPGKPLFALYRKTKDPKYKLALDRLRQQMRDHPRTSEGGFWHKKRYPSQMWLDGLYMGAPFLAEYAREFGEPALLDDVVKQFVLMETHARDPKTGLLYHGWDESRKQKWSDPKTGLSQSFWGRAVGWYAMGLVETLDVLPADHPGRKDLVAILDRLAAAVVRVQDPKTGVWWQVLDQPGREGNYLESSVSSMLAFALMKGARSGALDGKYGQAGARAYEGVVAQFVEAKDGQVHIHRVCQVAGLGGDPEKERYRDGTFEYYVKERIRSNDPKAVGPFIFASLEREQAGVAWSRVLDQPAGWYGSAEAVRVAESVVLHQRASGGWPKNVDMAAALDEAGRARLERERTQADATIDNGATWTQMRFLARVADAPRPEGSRTDPAANERFRASVRRGLDHLLAAQYPGGGWPQFFPLRPDYSRHVTFNDGAMIGVMRLLRDVASAAPPFAFVDADRRQAAARAVAQGRRAILAAQVRVEGRLTAWCAQHDAVTLEPRPARRYEPASLSGRESVEIVEYLMDEPGEGVAEAIEAAVAWLREARIEGQRVERVAAADQPEGVDVVVRPDPAAPPLWARFYEIGTNRPMFLGRDGVVRRSLAEIEVERRTHYSWLGPYAQDLLEHRYPAWRDRTKGHSGSLVIPKLLALHHALSSSR
jgi:unsaturated rhamnogalacturonyl hydrolase